MIFGVKNGQKGKSQAQGLSEGHPEGERASRPRPSWRDVAAWLACWSVLKTADTDSPEANFLSPFALLCLMDDIRPLIGIVSVAFCSFDQARRKAGTMLKQSQQTEFKVTRHAALGLEAEAHTGDASRTLYFNQQ